MGFPLGGCYVAVPETLILLLKFLDYLRFVVCLILFYLGLYPSSVPPTPYRDPEFDPTPASDALGPVTTTSIKARLPAVEFVSFVERSAGRCRESKCVVCLENLAAGDEVRELGNCRHAFHKGASTGGWTSARVLLEVGVGIRPVLAALRSLASF
ncbi:brassinosteroid-responsive RING protein 1 [Elaeis guineensis]|uniref:brassinosteroid-responsive RING protein 1 n=1 Tax=Elaeis guineensis var. tenera TaxID=51953 RepID=UPI003C6D287A